MKTIKLNHKKIRAEVIAEYLKGDLAVCLSCGNAARELKAAGVNLIPIDGQTLEAKRYITPEEIRRMFPTAFDATSGSLPPFLMERIADRIEGEIGRKIRNKELIVPIGSGELIAALLQFHNKHDIIGIYSNEYDPTDQRIPSPLTKTIRNIVPIYRVAGETAQDLKTAAGRFCFNEGMYIDTAAQ